MDSKQWIYDQNVINRYIVTFVVFKMQCDKVEKICLNMAYHKGVLPNIEERNTPILTRRFFTCEPEVRCTPLFSPSIVNLLMNTSSIPKQGCFTIRPIRKSAKVKYV